MIVYETGLGKVRLLPVDCRRYMDSQRDTPADTAALRTSGAHTEDSHRAGHTRKGPDISEWESTVSELGHPDEWQDGMHRKVLEIHHMDMDMVESHRGRDR